MDGSMFKDLGKSIVSGVVVIGACALLVGVLVGVLVGWIFL